jgi:glycosyltransferase involved in cell wall biosynthesis
MKIAICVPLDIRSAGGVETHIREITQAMRRLGVKVDIASNNTGAEYLPLKYFQAKQYDIIHTHGSSFCRRMINLALNRLPHQRHVHTLHGVSLDYLWGCKDWGNWRGYSSTLIEGICSRYADHVIAVSESISRRARQAFRLRPQKISVIPNGYHRPPTAQNSRDGMRKELGLNENEIVILFVGRGEDKVKGTATITSALNQLQGKHPHLRLLAVPGTGFGQAGWLCRSGPIEHEQMHEAYTAADIFVNASLNEGMPLTLIEAMAQGLPVVAAPVGGIPELITHNQTGLLLEQDRSDLPDQLNRLIENPDLRRRLGQNARQAVTHLTWENLARQTVKVYETVIAN